MTDDLAALRRAVIANSILVERMATAGQLGIEYDGKRDVYDAAGYKKVLTWTDFWNRYQRQDVAKRVVAAPADDTWVEAPIVLDGTDEADGRDDTEFVTTWNLLASGYTESPSQDDDGVRRRGLTHYLHRLDKLCGVGEYAVLLLGVADGQPLNEPLQANSVNGPQGLLYVNVLHQNNADISRWVEDESDPRYGLPEMYSVSLRSTAASASSVHWSRVLHVADNSEESDVYGTPRMRPVWNRLVDLEKVMAASGEAAWRLMQPGYVLTTQEGARLPVDTTKLTDLRDEIDDFTHGLRRWLLAQGIEPRELGGTLQDPTATVDVCLRLIAAATGIPKRILEGSERGELASSQDERNYARMIQTRRSNFAVPMILRPLVNRLIYCGVLPEPSSGSFHAYWESLIKPTELEIAETAGKVAEALNKAGIYIDPTLFMEEYFPSLMNASVDYSSQPTMDEEIDALVRRAQDEQGAHHDAPSEAAALQ